MRRSIALPFRSTTPVYKKRARSPPAHAPRVSTHDAKDRLDRWKAARRALVEPYNDIIGGVTPRVFYLVAGSEPNLALTRHQLGENLVEFITKSMRGSVSTELTVDDVFAHIDIHPGPDGWKLYDFFYTSASDGILPRWHSLAREILRKIVDFCGRVLLQDAATRNHVPIHLYRWLKLNEAADTKYVDVFDHRTSYYSTAGFEWYDWKGTAYAENIRELRDRFSQKFQQWWDESRDEILAHRDVLLHECPDEYMKVRMRDYEMPVEFSSLDEAGSSSSHPGVW